MLSDTIRCKKALTQLVRDYYDELASWTLTADNWAFIEQTHKALLPFNEYGIPSLFQRDGLQSINR
jgi:hypothetical protein